MALSKANPLHVVINGKTYDYLAFYFPGHNTDWDNVCGVPYFGNFWVEPFEVQLMGPVKASFYTAEAAYQASKWWDDSVIRNTFESKKLGAMHSIIKVIIWIRLLSRVNMADIILAKKPCLKY